MSGSVVSSFGGSFFSWFQDEVLPYLIATVNILIIVIGLILNILLIVTLKKRRLFSLPSNGLVFQLVLVDLICCVVVLIPGCIVAFLKFWPLTNIGCSIHAIVANWLYLATFCFLSLLMIERTVKQTNLERYDKTFASTRFVVGISLGIWGFCLVVSVVPVTGWGTIAYDFYHAACIVYHTDNIYYLIIIFVLGIGLSILVMFITLILIYKAKKKEITPEPAKNDKKAKNNTNTTNNKNTGPKSVWGAMSSGSNTSGGNGAKPAASGGNGAKPAASGGGNGAKPTAFGGNKLANSKLRNLAGVKKMKMAMTRMKVLNTFDKIKEIEKDPDFHLTVTYIIVWSIVLFCWIPYFITSFVDAINQNEKIWRGAYTITIIVANVSYCIKPIIYLAHNRHYREDITSTIPENVKAKATAVKTSISTFADKLDKAFFKSTPAGKKFNATLKATMIGKGWVNKIRMKKQLKLKGLAGTSTASASKGSEQNASSTTKTTNNAVPLTLTSLETVDENKNNVTKQANKNTVVKPENTNTVVKQQNNTSTSVINQGNSHTVVKLGIGSTVVNQGNNNTVVNQTNNNTVVNQGYKNTVVNQTNNNTVVNQGNTNNAVKHGNSHTVVSQENKNSVVKQENQNREVKPENQNLAKDAQERNYSVFNRRSSAVTPRDVNVVSKDFVTPRDVNVSKNFASPPNTQYLSKSKDNSIELMYVNGNVDLAFV